MESVEGKSWHVVPDFLEQLHLEKMMLLGLKDLFLFVIRFPKGGVQREILQNYGNGLPPFETGTAVTGHDMAIPEDNVKISKDIAKDPKSMKKFHLTLIEKVKQVLRPKKQGCATPLEHCALKASGVRDRAHVEKLLDPIKTTWKEKGVTIVSDGWSDTQRRPLINFMAVTELGPMFIKAVNCEGNGKDKYFMADLIKEVIMQVGAQYVVQVITNNALICKATGMLVEAQFPHIFWTSCVVHTLNLVLKNICDPSNIQSNKDAFIECHWIKEVVDRALMIKNFILNHNMVAKMFNNIAPLKLLGVAERRFASTIFMLKRLKLPKRALERHGQAFTSFDYDMWDENIEKVKGIIYRHERKEHFEESPFYDVVYPILIDRWTKSSSPLHCLAHSLNPRCNSDAWLNGVQGRQPSHLNVELSVE
ncbi:hypothetical protein AgCh_024508 [Apium graveolens]